VPYGPSAQCADLGATPGAVGAGAAALRTLRALGLPSAAPKIGGASTRRFASRGARWPRLAAGFLSVAWRGVAPRRTVRQVQPCSDGWYPATCAAAGWSRLARPHGARRRCVVKSWRPVQMTNPCRSALLDWHGTVCWHPRRARRQASWPKLAM